jgi:hypothetical protein
MSATSLNHETLKVATSASRSSSMHRNTGHLSSSPTADAPRTRRPFGDFLVYFVLFGLTWGVWQISRLGFFSAGDDVGYWIGVAGGVMMLMLFTYPLRKHFRFTHRWGKVKWWFMVHMLLGVGGPLLILLHSTFQVRSLNAGVALYSMIIVALSGVIGRFIYGHINRGLHGEQSSFRDLQSRAGLHQREARSRLRFAPAVEARLIAFGEHELTARPGFLASLRRVFWLPVKQWLTYRACMAELRKPMRDLAVRGGWDERSQAKRDRLARKLVRRYLNAVVRVAQFTAYERLFSLWHVAHLPFVYLLVISSIVHVVAVHAY